MPESYFAGFERVVADTSHLRELLSNVEAAARFLALEFYWRGQENAAWGVHSSLHRVIASSNQVPIELVLERDVREVEDRVVQTARPWVRPGVSARLPTLDLLARLQHHGVPTRLVDYTSDWRVAMFFACAQSPSTDGRLFLTAAREKPGEEMTDQFGLPWPDDRSHPWAARLMVVDGNTDFVRIRDQKGLFMVGGTPSTNPMRRFANGGPFPLRAIDVRQSFSLPLSMMSWGRIARAKEQKWGSGTPPKYASTLTLRIPAASKVGILQELASDQFRPVTWASVYPDPQGLSEILRRQSEAPETLTVPAFT